jgi:hypothetical protein
MSIFLTDVKLDTVKDKKVLATAADGKIESGEGADGTFTTVDGKTVTVTKGIITAIV